jgi:hypothetical protein
MGRCRPLQSNKKFGVGKVPSEDDMKAFISYTRSKDQFGVVSTLHNKLENELSLLDPQGEIFRDVNGLMPGDEFRSFARSSSKSFPWRTFWLS